MKRQSVLIRSNAFILFIFLFTAGNAQDIFFKWAKQLNRNTGLSYYEGWFLGVDNDKNVYVAGNYRNVMDADPGPGVFNLANANLDHAFIVKLDSLGNFLWGKSIGGDRYTIAQCMNVDPNGNIFISGQFSGTADFDPGPGTYSLTATYTSGPENHDLFILKLDPSGNFKWARKAGGLNDDAATDIQFDNNGNVFTTGSFIGVVDFDPGPTTVNLGTNGWYGVFVTKHDSTGNLVWAREFRSVSPCTGTCVRPSKYGNIYVTGLFQNNGDFDPGPATYPLTGPYNYNYPFTVKLDAAGNFIWANTIGGDKIETDQFENLISFTGLLAKYSPSGSLIWYKAMAGRPSGYPGSSTIRLDKAGNIYTTGEFNYTKDFDPGPGVFNLTAFGNAYPYDAFICRMDPDGNFVYAKSFGGWGEDRGTSIALDTSGNVYTAGMFVSLVDFDPGPGIFNMQSFSGGGIFIHKMARCANVTYNKISVNTCTSFTLNNITYDRSGTYTQTLVNTTGCDSIITIDLLLHTDQTNISASACESYYWNNETLTASGIYFDTLTAVNGCDSIVRLDLVIKSKTSSVINSTICEGDSYEGYTATGTYVDTFVNAKNCDSARKLILTVIPRKYVTLEKVICQGSDFAGYTSPGTYVDTLTAASGCDSIRTTILAVNNSYKTSVDTTICEGQSWLGHTQSGTYIDKLSTISGCDSTVTSRLTVLKKPVVSFGRDTILCEGDIMTLSAGSGDTYLWQDGSDKNYFIVRSAGLYSVTTANSCGTSSDEIMIREQSCNIVFPNAFTPNNDGKNDQFKILNPSNIKRYHLKVFNRWGQLIFETTNPINGWNGTYHGQHLDSGVFVWHCEFSEGNTTRNLKGTVVLIN